MDTNFAVDRFGKVFELKSFCTYCMVIVTSVLPEVRPVDIVCFAEDGYIFGQLRDSDFRGSETLDNHKDVFQAELFKDKFLPPGVNGVYCHIHPSNKRAISWLLGKGWIKEGSFSKNGEFVDKYYLSAESMISNAEAIKSKVV